MNIEEKEIDGVKYVPAKVFWDVWKDWQEDIEETTAEIKKLKTEIYNLKHPEEAARIKSYLKYGTV
jgi:hypothetical protein